MENELSPYMGEYVYVQLEDSYSQITPEKCFHDITTPEISFKGNMSGTAKRGEAQLL